MVLDILRSRSCTVASLVATSSGVQESADDTAGSHTSSTSAATGGSSFLGRFLVALEAQLVRFETGSGYLHQRRRWAFFRRGSEVGVSCVVGGDVGVVDVRGHARSGGASE